MPWCTAAQSACKIFKTIVTIVVARYRMLRTSFPIRVVAYLTVTVTACYTPSSMPLYARAERLSNGPAFEAQHTTKDCGIASAAILLRLRHKAVSYSGLAEPLGARRDDALTFAQLRGLLAVHGLVTSGIRFSESDLIHLRSPVIAWIPPGHYVVVEPGLSGDVIVTDPAAGRWIVPKAQWIRYWTGYALVPNDALRDLAISDVGPTPHVPLTE